MKVRMTRRLVWLVLSLAVATASCVSPATPSGSPSIAAPRPQSPVDRASIAHASQPVVLRVANAVSTGASPTYKFEVATDSAFTSLVQAKSEVAEGANGQTTVSLDPLAAALDYYWRVRADSGSMTGVYGPTYKFTIGPVITLVAPTLVAPANGSSTAGWPVFTVSNGSHSATSGAVTYRFEVATNAAFTFVVLSTTVSEGSGQTTISPAPRVAPPAQTLFWRVTMESSVGVSATSAVQSFTPVNTPQSNLATLQGFILWSGVQPPGSNIGRAPLGPGWDPGTLVSNCGTTFSNPLLENLQLLDLLDRGLQPQAAIDWMNANGYENVAAWYPGPVAFGLRYQYMAAIDGNGNPNINGSWELVTRGNEGGC